MKRFSKNKEINVYIRQLIKYAHWSCAQGKRHNSIFSPLGKRITVPSTPSDYRAYLNFKKNIQRTIQREAS